MYKINKYPDGTGYITIPEEWQDTTQEITFRVNSYIDVVHLVQLFDALIFNRVKAHVVIPCLIDAQADRRFGDFNSSGLAVIARILEDYIDGYNISIGVFHPHNPEVVEALFTSVEIIDNSEFVREVVDRLGWYDEVIDGKRKDLQSILMSSDAGGFKPLMKICEKLNWRGETYSAAKARSWDPVDGTKFIQEIGRQDFEGKDILIVDDICVYGGTFKGLAKLLRERNVGKLYLAVSHMTVKELGQDPVTNYFDKVFTTNSKYDKYYGRGDFEPFNLEIIKLFDETDN